MVSPLKNDSLEEQRTVIIFSVEKGVKACEIHARMLKVFGNNF